MSSPATTSGAEELRDIEAELDAAFPLPPIGRLVRVAALTVFVAFGGLTAWAFLTTIDQAVLATGNLIAEGRRKTVSVLEAGILREMLVKDGTRVVAGQVLFRLDTTAAQAAADQARAQYLGGQARLSRLRAEQADQRSFAVPAEVEAAAASSAAIRDVIETERRLFPARWEAFDGTLAVQMRQIDQLKAQLEGIPPQRRAAERQLAAISQRVRGFDDLARQGVGSRFQVLQLQEIEAAYTSNIANLTAQEAQSKQAIAQAEAQLATLRLNRQQEIANDMQQAAAQVAQAQQALKAAEEVLARRDVLAPEDAVVTNIQLYTPGSPFPAGQPVLDLIPGEDRLIVEARVMPFDIEHVTVGQRANIRLVPYRLRQTPMIAGRVIHVAADQQSDPNSGAYFLVRLELNAEELATVPNLLLTAGMPTESYIIGEPRTAASYIVAPIRDAMNRALRD